MTLKSREQRLRREAKKRGLRACKGKCDRYGRNWTIFEIIGNRYHAVSMYDFTLREAEVYLPYISDYIKEN